MGHGDVWFNALRFLARAFSRHSHSLSRSLVTLSPPSSLPYPLFSSRSFSPDPAFPIVYTPWISITLGPRQSGRFVPEFVSLPPSARSVINLISLRDIPTSCARPRESVSSRVHALPIYVVAALCAINSHPLSRRFIRRARNPNRPPHPTPETPSWLPAISARLVSDGESPVLFFVRSSPFGARVRVSTG